MKKFSKIVILGTAAVAGVLALGIFVSPWGVQAADRSGSSLVEKIATTFHLDEDKVQAVFDRERSERQAERLKTRETKLDELVKEGKLTNAQKNTYLELLKKIDDKRDQLRSTHAGERPEEIPTELKTLIEDLQAWVKEQKLEAVLPMRGLGRGPGGHGRGM